MNYFLSKLTIKSETISSLIAFMIIGLFISVPITYLPTFSQTNNTNTSSLTNSNQLATYEDPLLGFKFQYPTEWKQLLDKNIGNTGVAFNLFKVLNDKDLRLAIFTDNLPENETLKQYLREYISNEGGCCVDHQSLKINQTKFGGVPAMNTSWNEIGDKGEVFGKNLLVFAIKDKIGYAIHYNIYENSSELYDKYLPTVKNIIKSFQITD